MEAGAEAKVELRRMVEAFSHVLNEERIWFKRPSSRLFPELLSYRFVRENYTYTIESNGIDLV